MNHIHACVSRLVFWSVKPEIQERYPRSCRAIRLLQRTWSEETPGIYQKTIKRRRLRLGSLASANDGRRRRRLPTADGGPALASQRRPMADFEEAEATYLRELGRKRQVFRRMKQECMRLKEQVKNFKTTKTLGGRLSQEWILRVILSAPNASGSGLVDAFKIAVASDSSVISRQSMSCIKASFLEFWKDMNHEKVQEFLSMQLQGVVSETARGVSAAPRFLGVILLHVQDEAELRLLSSDSSSRPGLPRRSRTSKVQLHVVRLLCKRKEFQLPQELQALQDKSAATLATSFLSVLQTWMTTVKAALPKAAAYKGSRSPKEIWFTHCLVGDGIATNEAAAKLLWEMRGT